MEDWKNNIEFQDEQPEQETEKKRDAFKEFLDGRVLLRSFVVKQLPFVMFIAILAIVYIGNRYHVEKLVRRTSVLQTELNELRAEAITVSAELMYQSRQSEVIKLLNRNNINLVESVDPPQKIVVR